MSLLKEEIAANSEPGVFNSYEDGAAILKAFRRQLAAFTRQDAPFQLHHDLGTLLYWRAMKEEPKASVLAVRVFFL